MITTPNFLADVFPIFEAVLKDGSRIDISGVLLDFKEKKVHATDGKILATLDVDVPAQLSARDPVILPYALYESFKNNKNFYRFRLGWEDKAIHVLFYKNTFTFQFVEAVFPDVSSVTLGKRQEASIGIDPRRLLQLAESMNIHKDAGLILSISTESQGRTSPIRVTMEKDPTKYGLIMPLKYDSLQ